MKTELSISESAKLIELGVDAKLASKCLLYFCDEYDEPLASWDRYEDNGKVLCATEEAYGRSVESRIVSMDADFDQSAKEENPIFDLSDVINIVPKQIPYPKPNRLQILYPFTKSGEIMVRYATFDDASVEKDFIATELIDALNQLLIWCINNGKYNPKNEEK